MAYAEGYLINCTYDDVTVEELLQSISAKFDPHFITSQIQILNDRGLTHLKHFKGLKKKSFYDLGIAVLIAQELRKEVKRYIEGKAKVKLDLSPSDALSNMSLSDFRLPIVGSQQAKALMSASPLSGDTPTNLSMTSAIPFEVLPGDRVVRQVDGERYEYDRKCPHKGVDLSTVFNNICVS